jgi:hypothetical protein
MPNFLQALRERILFLAPELTNVYLSGSDPSAQVPFGIINRLWIDPFLNSKDLESYEEVQTQITLFFHTDTQAELIGKKVYRGLWPREANPHLSFDDGYEMGRVPGRLIGPVDEANAHIGDQKVWRVMFDVTWNIGINHV